MNAAIDLKGPRPVFDWRAWTALAFGQPELAEVRALRREQGQGAVRDARRLVRRGEAATDLREARAAAAIARFSQQRQGSRKALAVFILLPLGCIGFLVAALVDGHPPVNAVFWAILLVLSGRLLWIAVLLRRHAATAELANMRVLESSAPTAVSDPGLGDPHPLARVAAAVFAFAFYDLSFGATALALQGRSLIPVGHVVTRGLLFAVMTTIFNATLLPAIREGQDRRPTAGQHNTT